MRNIEDLSTPNGKLVLVCVGGNKCCPYSHSVCNKRKRFTACFSRLVCLGRGEVRCMGCVQFFSLYWKPVSLFRVLVVWSTWCQLAANSARSDPLLRTKRAIWYMRKVFNLRTWILITFRGHTTVSHRSTSVYAAFVFISNMSVRIMGAPFQISARKQVKLSDVFTRFSYSPCAGAVMRP
jgi:hypothetical protein